MILEVTVPESMDLLTEVEKTLEEHELHTGFTFFGAVLLACSSVRRTVVGEEEAQCVE